MGWKCYSKLFREQRNDRLDRYQTKSSMPCKKRHLKINGTIVRSNCAFTLMSSYFFFLFSSNISLVSPPITPSLYVKNNVSSQGESTTNMRQPFMFLLVKGLFVQNHTSFFWPRNQSVYQQTSLQIFLCGRNCFSHKTKFRLNQKNKNILSDVFFFSHLVPESGLWRNKCGWL